MPSPFRPINRIRFRCLDGQICGLDPVGEQNSICTRPTGTRHEKPVESQKVRNVGDALRYRIVAILIPRNIDPKLREGGKVRQVQGALDRDFQSVNTESNFGREHRLQVEQSMKLCSRAVMLQARVENRELSVAPTAHRRSTLQRVASLANETPSTACEHGSRQRIDPIDRRSGPGCRPGQANTHSSEMR
jgi:hypothetical protein